MPSLYFFDTSALVARFLPRAPGHVWVSGICAPASGNVLAIAEITEAELAATLNQLVRGGILRKKRCDDALELFWRQIDAGEYLTTSITSAIVRRAANLCGAYSLKGYDAVQLSCALTVREDARLLAQQGAPPVTTGDPILLTEDNRLLIAVQAESFVVDNPLGHP